MICRGNSPIPIPISEMALETPIWVNTDFAERILRLSEEDPTVHVIDIFSKPATSKGDNYTSDLIRVTVDFTRKQDQKELKGKKSLLFKFEPMADGLRKDLVNSLLENLRLSVVELVDF